MGPTAGMFDVAGPNAGRIASLALIFLGISVVVYLLVLAALALAMRRGWARRNERESAEEARAAERRAVRTVLIAAGATVVVLFFFVAASARTGRAIAWTQQTPTPITVEVTGHQWWWEFRYRDTVPSRWLSTSNELHIPVGRPVRVILRSNDVIHSFWIPSLHGKQDMIPGHQNTTWLQADRPGVWRAQCAEFCGHQHAKMAFDVVAEPQAQFDRWYEQQLAAAAEPTDSSARRGREVFLQNACLMCHTIAGTPAGSRVGPDLTHLASRPSIGAGTLPHTRGHLAGWIVDPQRIKPGVRMPPNQLSPDDLNALLDYLQSLK